MASPNILTGGIGGLAGAELATVSPLQYSGEVWYVHSPTGSDAASPRGRERIRPLATLAQAITNAGNNDIIVLMSGHQESLASITTIAETGLRLIGEGSGSARPRLTSNMVVADEMLDVTGAGVIIDNIYFPATTGALGSLPRIRLGAAGCVVRNCYFECGTFESAASSVAIELITGANNCRIEDTVIASTSTLVTSQPTAAILVTNAVTDLTLRNLTLDGGASGWSNPFAFVGTGAVTRLLATNLDLLNDSDLTLATGSSYQIHVRNKSGSARLVLTA